MKLHKNRKKGFTLIELIVVIAILGILAAILIPQFSGFQRQAKFKAALSEARSCATAIDSYYAMKSTYATTAQELVDAGFLTSQLATGLTNLQNDGGFTYTTSAGYIVNRATTESLTDTNVTEPAAATTTTSSQPA